jgi:hypothetical protein
VWLLRHKNKNDLERDGRQSTPSSTEVKNGWSCTSVSPICLHGVDSDFTVYIFVNEYIRFVRKSEHFDPARVDSKI